MRPSRRAPSVLLLAVAACLISDAAAEDGEMGEGSCVSSLETGNFEAAIKGKNALVVFFAPWCGHCKALHPHFERLCTDLSDQDDFFAAVVDATEEVELAQSHGVTGARRGVTACRNGRTLASADRMLCRDRQAFRPSTGTASASSPFPLAKPTAAAARRRQCWTSSTPRQAGESHQGVGSIRRPGWSSPWTRSSRNG